MIRAAFFVLACVLLSACAVTPLPNRQCGFKTYAIEVAHPAAYEVPSLEKIVSDAYANGTAPPDLLLMSGGSEHGSFGAGVLAGWGSKKAADGQPKGLPHFELVTGVSTGAILASPAFAGDYIYAAERYAKVREHELLTPYARKRDGKIAMSSAPSLLRHGAVADLNPMRTILEEYLVGQGGFKKIADRSRTGKLLIGAVDVDSGQMVAFDMSDMAHRIVYEPGEQDPETLKKCYYDVIQASASAPLAATPVFIDNRMYADGGMRFALFGERVIDILRDLKRQDPNLRPPNLYLIMNGTNETKVWCPRDAKDRRDCSLLSDSGEVMTEPPPKWNLIDLGLRSVDILSNQVARFSVRNLELENQLLFGETSQNFRYLRIERSGETHRFSSEAGKPPKTCAEWRQIDEELDQPLQFHHRYMACMVDYGKTRAAVNPKW